MPSNRALPCLLAALLFTPGGPARAQGPVDVEGVLRGAGRPDGVSFMSGRYLPDAVDGTHRGAPVLAPLAAPRAAAGPALWLSSIPAAELDPDRAVNRWLGAPDTLEDSRVAVSLYHHTLIADRHVINGDAAAALDHLEEALALDPLNQAILERAARAAEMAGQPGRSRLHWGVLANLNNRSAEFQYQRILALCRDGHLGDAAGHLEQARALDPRHAGLRLVSALLAPDARPDPLGILTLPEMAGLLREIHLRRDALATAFPGTYGRVARRVLVGGVDAGSTNLTAAADASFWARTAALGQRYLVDAEQAMRGARAQPLLAALDTAGKIGVDGPWFRLYRAQAWLDAGRTDEGARALQQVVDGYATEPDIAYRAARILLDLGRPEEAATLFNLALQREKDRPEFRFGLVCALIAQGSVGPALGQYRLLEQRHPAELAEWIKGDEPYLRELRERVRR